jgi:hypothetical protein
MDQLYAVRDDVLPRLMSKCKPTFLSLDLAAHIAGPYGWGPYRRRLDGGRWGILVGGIHFVIRRRATPGRIRGCTYARGGGVSLLGKEAAIRAALWRISCCLSGCPSLRCLPRSVGFLGSLFVCLTTHRFNFYARPTLLVLVACGYLLH